jgi:hypothetical protein
MLERTKVENASLEGLLEKLTIENERNETSYVTPNREDYFELLNAALNGKLDGVVSVGRSGIYLNKCLIHPPADA